jgi:hypothetical protein
VCGGRTAAKAGLFNLLLAGLVAFKKVIIVGFVARWKGKPRGAGRLAAMTVGA